MKTASAPKLAVSLLAPSAALPSEGDEAVFGRPTGLVELLGAYQQMVSTDAPRFHIKDGDINWQCNLVAGSSLQAISLASGDEGAQIEPRAASSHMDWPAVLGLVAREMDSPHFLNTTTELVRVFAAAVRSEAAKAAKPFRGIAVPLLAVDKQPAEAEAEIVFLGIWLADEPSIREAHGSLHDGSVFMLEGAEAEGRGLKEALVAAAMLAVVFQSSATAGESQRPAAQRGFFASLFGGGSPARGETLKVTSQRLVQEPPRIYRGVLERPHSDLRVIINIGAQRAYLVKDGQIAFETPISSGQGASWTPRGTFSITEKVRSGKISTIYDCPLPGWMRIGNTKVGMHEGQLPGYPASHGCVRMPIESAHFIFDHAPKGTTVQIVDSWSPPSAAAGTLVAQN